MCSAALSSPIDTKTSFIAVANPEVLDPAFHGTNSIVKGAHSARRDGKRVSAQSQRPESTDKCVHQSVDKRFRNGSLDRSKR